VGQPGIEPGTSVLSGLRSNRLSYWPENGHLNRRRVVGKHRKTAGSNEPTRPIDLGVETTGP
jgi:hypothetical protein